MKHPTTLVLAAALLQGCASFVPAAIASHDSDPAHGYPVNDDYDTATDFVGAGGCVEKRRTEACLFGGARRETAGTVSETGFGIQSFVMYKFRGRE